MELPKVTIIIANHNYGRYISDAIESALNQNYPKDKLTIFIVDDGSTDDSIEKISTFFDNKTGPYLNSEINGIKLKLISLKDSKGPSAARNIAIQNSIHDTDVFAILDADDIYYPDKVFKCVNKILDAPESIGAVYTDYDILNVETGNVVREFKEPYSLSRLMDECIVHSGAVITSKALSSVVENNQFYDNAMRTCEDYDLWIRIGEKFMLAHIPESLSLVRNHVLNSSNTVSSSIWKLNWQRIRQKMKQRHG